MPILSGLISALIFSLAQIFVCKIPIGLIRLYGYTRFALILSGAFGAYSLGANNITNVISVLFLKPFSEIQQGGGHSISSIQQLFLVGKLVIAAGVFTYSKRVMMTVGKEMMRLTPLAAWLDVIAHSIVLFLFTSERLEQLFAKLSLQTIPLVPV